MEALREEVSFSDQVYHGDALDVLKTLPDQSVDAICCDPPAGISFMNMAFDHNRGGRDQWIAWLSSIMTEALRVLKPGGHALVWALPRTSHWTACALEDAGFEIRDKCYHLFGSGFPKSHNISIAVDKYLGVEREIIGVNPAKNSMGRMQQSAKEQGARKYTKGFSEALNVEKYGGIPVTAPASPEAQQWQGWGTALKPSCEEWILCRKPLSEASVAKNVLTHGTGALNIDACRIASNGHEPNARANKHPSTSSHKAMFGNMNGIDSAWTGSQGRWPAQLLLSHTLLCTDDECDVSCPVAVMDAQSGIVKSGGNNVYQSNLKRDNGFLTGMPSTAYHLDKGQGGASRYFAQFRPTPDDYPPFIYASKASRRERNAGCDALPEKSPWTSFDGQYAKGRNPVTGERSEHEYKREQSNHHPTVKSQSLMRYLVRLITPPDGVVLDCFAGSGSTGVAAIAEGFHYILIEQSAEYIDIINARIAHAKGTMFK